jgi:hypothetical protein
MKEAAEFLGVDTAAEVSSHASKAKSYFARKLAIYGFSGIQLSPYKQGEWTISGITPGKVCFFSHSVELAEWMDTPNAAVRAIVEKYSNKVSHE